MNKNPRTKCHNCGAEDVDEGIGGYSVKQEIWQKYSKGKDILCIHCLELSMNRRLQKSDIILLNEAENRHFGDNKTNKYIQIILNEIK